MRPLEPNKVLAKYTPADGEELTLTTNVVRNILSNNANVTDQEILFFVALCKSQKLNPFTREAYLVKYGNQAATQLVSYTVLLKRAFAHPKYAGMESGITMLSPDGRRIVRREGYAPFKRLGGAVIGAWARVHIKGYECPIYVEVDFDEFAGKKKDGSLNSMWSKMPGVMIHKVAVAHALRLAFPCEFSGMYVAEEFGNEEPKLQPVKMPDYEPPVDDVEQTSEAEVVDYGPEGWSEMDDADKAAFVEQVAKREPRPIMPDMDYDLAQFGFYETAQAAGYDQGWEEF